VISTVTIKRIVPPEREGGSALLIAEIPFYLLSGDLSARLAHLQNILGLDSLTITSFADSTQFIYLYGDGDLVEKANIVARYFVTTERLFSGPVTAGRFAVYTPPRKGKTTNGKTNL
jgi:hypothetical protein